ncbi:MAG: sensor histidine kinase [Treponema sp.]|nr:sensor histidine kinase [Treponema sp.]
MKPLSFSRRLLLLFIMCSTLPLFLLSFVFSEISRQIVSRNASRHAEEVSRAILLRFEKTLSSSAELAEELSQSRKVRDWCGGSEDAALIPDLFQSIAGKNRDDIFQVYIVSDRQPEHTISRRQVPEEYRDSLYGDWGVFHKARASRETSFFAQPHPGSASNAAIAVCTPVPDSSSPDGSAHGFVIVDILRQGLEKQLGSIDGMEAFREFFIHDESGCIAFSLQSPSNESLFVQDMAGEGCPLLTLPAKTAPFSADARLSSSEDERYVRDLRRLAALTAVIAGFFSVGISALVSHSVAQPVQSLSDAMQQAAGGNLSVHCREPSGAFRDFDMLCLIRRFNSMVHQIARLTDERVEKEHRLRVAEIKNLQAQISPHFLYNTLNSIKSMAKFAGSPQIVRMVTNLGKLLRESIRPGGAGTDDYSDYYSIEQSLALVRNYFEIESMRWEGKFAFTEDIDATLLPYPIPRFVLQPVVENALVHGLEGKSGKGSLCIRGRFEDTAEGSRDIVLTVQDDGDGMDEAALRSLRAKLAAPKAGSTEARDTAEVRDRELGSNGIALVNTCARLRLLYGSGYGLSIQSQKGKGTEVTIRIREEVRNDKSTGR